jgi:Ca2+-dependent lipid-binding protein
MANIPGTGVLEITLLEANLTKDVEWLGKMDPYCTILFNKSKLKTSVKQDAGKTP